MGPTFTTEIGRMRTQEAIARAEHYRLAQMARKSSEPEGRVVTERRKSFFSWKRLVGVATAGLFGSLVVATSAVAVPLRGGGGGAADVGKATPSVQAPSSDLTLLIAVVAIVVVAAGAAAWIAWSGRRTPKLA